ncbi:MAG: cation:proton antiporter [Phycisphaerae bacterium]|nr:cation:proton antiporter [Phycisphaerae bacterium]
MAWLLGLVTHRLRLSPMVGYLIAGIIIGPYTPGIRGDLNLANQLAEVGVILLMFGVGLHFHVGDLWAVKGVAIPGAVGQSLVATLVGLALFTAFGWSTNASLTIGMAMAVASTVVLIRVLMDNNLLSTFHGHAAVGWLIVEDIFTVVILVLIPVIAATGEAGGAGALAKALLKLGAFVGIIALLGSRVISWTMVQVARLRSRELFTLTVLVMSITVAAGALHLFGASLALGAFLAGMVVAQTPVSQQAGADVLPLRDSFTVLFFVAVGMQFDPHFLTAEPKYLLAALGIVMIAKPLTAVVIVIVSGYTIRTGLVAALGLAQIGEFTFLVSQEATKNKLLPLEAHNILIAVAIISISLNPLLFHLLDPIESTLKKRPRLWRLLNLRASRHMEATNAKSTEKIQDETSPLTIVVGYGPVGQSVDRLLRESGFTTTIVDLNMDTINNLNNKGMLAIYGDASSAEVLKSAGIAKADYLVITLPHSINRAPLITAARQINPLVKIIVRARYLQEARELEQLGTNGAVYEEAEAAVAIARTLLSSRGAHATTIKQETDRIRSEFSAWLQV